MCYLSKVNSHLRNRNVGIIKCIDVCIVYHMLDVEKFSLAGRHLRPVHASDNTDAYRLATVHLIAVTEIHLSSLFPVAPTKPVSELSSGDKCFMQCQLAENGSAGMFIRHML